jgi:hypothetical protein
LALAESDDVFAQFPTAASGLTLTVNKKGDVKTFLGSVHVKLPDHFPTSTCTVHIIDGIVVPVDPSGIDFDTCNVRKGPKELEPPRGSVPNGVVPEGDIASTMNKSCDVMEFTEGLIKSPKVIQLLSQEQVRTRWRRC